MPKESVSKEIVYLSLYQSFSREAGPGSHGQIMGGEAGNGSGRAWLAVDTTVTTTYHTTYYTGGGSGKWEVVGMVSGK